MSQRLMTSPSVRYGLALVLCLLHLTCAFEYSGYCVKMCTWGRGGNLCKCNAVHFAGKRVPQASDVEWATRPVRNLDQGLLGREEVAATSKSDQVDGEFLANSGVRSPNIEADEYMSDVSDVLESLLEEPNTPSGNNDNLEIPILRILAEAMRRRHRTPSGVNVVRQQKQRT
nr:HFAamide [Urechis unicinctus]